MEAFKVLGGINNGYRPINNNYNNLITQITHLKALNEPPLAKAYDNIVSQEEGQITPFRALKTQFNGKGRT